MTAPMVSIIVTTKNEEKNIKNCLQSIRNQTFPLSHIEILVVDNNSLDNTKKIAKRYTNKVFNFGPERSAQRNYGLKKSKGKYYLYLDADMILSRNVVNESVRKLEKEADLIGLYIPEVVIGKGFWSKTRRFERSFYDATVIDCVRIIRTKDLKKVHGFNESLTGPEDWDLDKKIRKRGKTGLIKARIFHNEKAFRLIDYIQKKNYYSKSFDRYIKKWGKDDSDIKKQFGFYYRLLGVFIEHGKWKRLLKHPILTVRMYFIKFFIGIIYLKSKLKTKRTTYAKFKI